MGRKRQEKNAERVNRVPRLTYRYLREEAHALAFVAGRVWLSTFSEIRRGDTARGDPDEGLRAIAVEKVDPDTPQAEAAEIRRRLLPVIGLGPGASLKNVTIVNRHPDAYVLCTSLSRDNVLRQRFGRYCVRIADPHAFAELTAAALVDAGFGLERAEHAPVQYLGRRVVGASGHWGHPAFANVSGNQDEREYRTVWTPKPGLKIAPLELRVPGAETLCSIV